MCCVRSNCSHRWVLHYPQRPNNGGACIIKRVATHFPPDAKRWEKKPPTFHSTHAHPTFITPSSWHTPVCCFFYPTLRFNLIFPAFEVFTVHRAHFCYRPHLFFKFHLGGCIKNIGNVFVCRMSFACLLVYCLFYFLCCSWVLSFIAKLIVWTSDQEFWWNYVCVK